MTEPTPPPLTLIDVDPAPDSRCVVCRRPCSSGCGLLVLPDGAGRVWFCERLCLDLWFGGIQHGAVKVPGSSGPRRRRAS